MPDATQEATYWAAVGWGPLALAGAAAGAAATDRGRALPRAVQNGAWFAALALLPPMLIASGLLLVIRFAF